MGKTKILSNLADRMGALRQKDVGVGDGRVEVMEHEDRPSTWADSRRSVITTALRSTAGTRGAGCFRKAQIRIVQSTLSLAIQTEAVRCSRVFHGAVWKWCLGAHCSA
eukprot:6843019-Pyramimonas_sp.AAC.1